MMNTLLFVSLIGLAMLNPGNQPPALKPEPAPVDTRATAGKDWAAVPQPIDTDALGRGIQRTLRLLATSTPKHRHTVRILFYGQSITEQKWSQQVADDLRKRFPNADLEIQNRAIGGFASQLLIRPAEHDVYPFYPDLVIFHVYGADKEYEEIIRNIRTRTTAEVLMQKDHATFWPPEQPDPNTDKGKWWDSLMNNHRLPEIAKKYGCGLVDVRSEWLRYLKTNHLQPKDLLVDGVHLNDHGCYLMAGIINQYLVYRPDLKPSLPSPVQDVPIGKTTGWKNGRLTLDFTGNRVDLLPTGEKTAGAFRVLIDGKAPSAHPECYAITRPQPNPWASPLALARVDHTAPPVAEEWTLTVTGVTGEKENTNWDYEVIGSVTGLDGKGKSNAPFNSISGRVVIEQEAFFRGFHPPLPVGHRITWRSYVQGQDRVTLLPPADQGKENAITVAQGLQNGPHRLELIQEGVATPTLRTIRIYHPQP